ncbi:hypothetical protein AB5N19_06540 [Seiridium cardinale]|uniref:Uncharacterized protein n=1 Tax=Seiridium cardinale TaxID=138064 RepID=A0ABR2XZ86_9PEZI
MGERHRQMCLEALDLLLDTQSEIVFKIDSHTGKYERRFWFADGLYLRCISTREGLRNVSLRHRGLVDVLEDMARNDGVRGRTMAYGIAAYFGIQGEEAPRELASEDLTDDSYYHARKSNKWY